MTAPEDRRLAKLAARELGLGGDDAHHLGSFAVGDSPAFLGAVTKFRLQRVRDYFERRAAENTDWYLASLDDGGLEHTARYDELQRLNAELAEEAEKFSFLSYEEYLVACRRSDPHKWPSSDDIAANAAERVFARRRTRHRHTPDRDGYRRYLEDVVPGFAALLTRRVPVHLPEDDLLRHIYVNATTESGKTELLKLLVHVTLARDAAVVLLDPHGDLAEQVARFREFADADRLVYLNPGLADGHAPTLNPLEVRGPFRHIGHELEVKAVAAEQIADAFAEMLGGEPGVLTDNMRALLEPCLTLLIDTPGATLEDLGRLMDEKRNDGLVERGKRARHKRVREFFAHRFRDPGYDPSKGALSRRLDRLFNSQAFERLTCGSSTIDLERALAERKVIVVNLAAGRLGVGGPEAFGRLVIAALRAIAFRRVDLPEAARVPVHLVVDEAQTFITKSLFTILGQTRKFKLYAILSQLMPGHGMSTEERALLLDATKTKFIGQSTGGQAQRESAALAGVPPEELDRLRMGEFFVRRQGRPTFRFRTATHLLGHSHDMGEAAWARVRRAQLGRYYRPLEAPTPEPAEPVSEHPSRGRRPATRAEPLGADVLRPPRKRI